MITIPIIVDMRDTYTLQINDPPSRYWAVFSPDGNRVMCDGDRDYLMSEHSLIMHASRSLRRVLARRAKGGKSWGFCTECGKGRYGYTSSGILCTECRRNENHAKVARKAKGQPQGKPAPPAGIAGSAPPLPLKLVDQRGIL